MATFHISVKSGKRGSAASHAAYITRSGIHSKKQLHNDLVLTATGNLPAWANGNARAFWSAADRYERSNGSAYREYELALPAELSAEQNLALVDEFVREEVGSRPYQLAIHAPVAAIGGVPQPHVHIMMSDRVPDGIERPPEQHFSRFNPKSPALGGCKKESGGKSPAEVREGMVAFRERCAARLNYHLRKHGHEEQVDHRSLKDQGACRTPERHLGPARVNRMSSEDKVQHVASRNQAKEAVDQEN